MQFDIGRGQKERQIFFGFEFTAVQVHFPDLAIPAYRNEITGILLQWVLFVGGNNILIADPQMELRTVLLDTETVFRIPTAAVIDYGDAPAAARHEATGYGEGRIGFERRIIRHGEMSILILPAAE